MEIRTSIQSTWTNQPQTSALIITAQYDPLNDEAQAYANSLRKAGVRVISKCIPDVIHCFLDLPVYEEKQKDIWLKEIDQLLKELITSCEDEVSTHRVHREPTKMPKKHKIIPIQ